MPLFLGLLGPRKLAKPKKNGPDTTSALTVAVASGLVYIFFACVLAVLAFKNFPLFNVLSAVLLLSFPAVIAFITDIRSSKVFLGKIGPRGIATSFLVATVSILIQSSSIRSGHSFFTNFPNDRIESGEGFNLDSAFHVSIIQSILSRGYPSTGQHLEPFLEYHTLSHYGDALVLWATGLDPWESYALLFFSKSAAIVLATIYFSYRVTRNGREKLFLTVAPVVALIFTNSWTIVISHANWLPMYLVVLASPWMYALTKKTRVTIGDSIILTAIVVVASLGKISVGFSVAVFIGLVLFVKEPRRPLVVLMGMAWAGFFFVWSRGFSGASLIRSWADAFRDVPAEAFSIVGICLVFLLAYKLGGAKHHLGLALAIALSASIHVFVGLFFLRSPLDTAAFFVGLFAIVFLISTQSLLGVGVWERHNLQQREMALMPAAVVALALTLASMPTLAKAPLAPFRPPMAVLDSVFLTNTVSYQWFNHSKPPNERMSIMRAFTGSGLPIVSESREPYFSTFRTSLETFLEEDSINPADALLFLSSEQFEELAQKSEIPNSENLGFLLVAVNGISLIYGMPALDGEWKSSFFGNSRYGQEALRIPATSATEATLCQWNRPVVRIENLERPTFKLYCGRDDS